MDKVQLSLYFNNIQIQHFPSYSYGEKIAVLRENREDRTTMANSYSLFSNWLNNVDSPWNVVETSQDSSVRLLGSDVRVQEGVAIAQDSNPISIERPIEVIKQDYLRIYISSPSDLETERGITYKVINDVQETLRILKDHISVNFVHPLSALDWEKVPPNVGLPNQVILDRFQIDECDILIFILWKRFGVIPQTKSASGKFVSSGTEEEFLQAFEKRKINSNGRPVIMLYRKTDEFSLMGIDAKEIKQYEKVIRFFQECDPSGKHPTLFYDFKTSDFELVLRKHLLDNILKLYKDMGEGGDSQESTREDQSAKAWFNLNNLSGDPFHLRFAEDEADLTKYYVRFKNLQLNIDYLLNDKNGWLIFGREGSGKTALRRFLITKRQSNPQVRCIEYSDEEEFTAALTEEQDIEKIALSIAIQIGETVLKNAGINASELRNATDPSSVFLLLREKLKSQNVEQILIFIDPFRKAVKNVSKVSSVLAQLANVSLEGVGLRFFLPKNIYLTLSNKQHSYIGRCNPMEIKWDVNELLDLIRYRLIYYSKEKRNAVSSMGALGEPKGGMDRIDQAIVGLSENNPRAVIWLADQLISKHCQNQPIPLKIQRQTWDQVQEEWWSWGRNHVLGLPGQEDRFWRSGSNIFFKDERLEISKQSKTLLEVLIEADGQICSKEKLIKAGWANENKEGVTEAALREAMRRLKNELAERQIWLKTIHGQGYRLQNPDEPDEVEV